MVKADTHARSPSRRPFSRWANSVLSACDAAGAGKTCLVVALASLLSSAFVGAFIARYMPTNHDQSAYLLAGQTFAHLRLTNPTPANWRFFETQHVLMHPTYMAKFPPGQGMAIAVGYWLGNPIYGVWLESALFAASIVWMLRGFFSNRWAVLGGLLAILQFGVTHYWAQSFWGGALAASGGALVFGSLPRLRRAVPRPGDGAMLGAGIALLMVTRPFEGALACVVPAAALAWPGAPTAWRSLLPCAAVVVAAAAWLAYDNYRVTGDPWRFPYVEYERQYSGAPLLVWQHASPEPRFENSSMQDFYRSYVLPGSRFGSPALSVWAARLSADANFMLGFELALVAVVGLLWRPSRWSLLALASVAIVSAALVVSFWFGPHYQAPVAAAYVFLGVAGIRVLCLASPPLRRHFLVAACVVIAAKGGLLLARGAPARDVALRNTITAHQWVADILERHPGRYLVFVHREMPYDVNVSFVFNDADIDASAVVFAWDRGADEDRKLAEAFPTRKAFMLREAGENVTLAPFAPAGR